MQTAKFPFTWAQWVHIWIHPTNDSMVLVYERLEAISHLFNDHTFDIITNN